MSSRKRSSGTPPDVCQKRKRRASSDQWENCTYNPGHREFLPVNDYNISKCNLPKDYEDQLTDSYIKSVIGLTARLDVTYVSPQRPDNYPLSESRGKTVITAGSGMVCSVLRKFNTNDDKGCPCNECEPKKVMERTKNWGMYEVLTANHVVYNDEECGYTTVYIDYDDSGKDLISCDKLNGFRVSRNDRKQDRCSVQCVSHNEELCQKLENRVMEYIGLYDQLMKKYKKCKGSKIPVICVSHPHGRSKRVSVGKLDGVKNGDSYSWRYTTATCRGCSGAPVFILGERLRGEKPYHIAVHTSYGGPGYNESGCWNTENL